MYTKLPNGQIVYEEDYSCIVEPQNGRGGIFIGNLEASQNIKTLKSILPLKLRTWHQGRPHCSQGSRFDSF